MGIIGVWCWFVGIMRWGKGVEGGKWDGKWVEEEGVGAFAFVSGGYRIGRVEEGVGCWVPRSIGFREVEGEVVCDMILSVGL